MKNPPNETPTNLPEPKKIPRGWIPPPPYRLRSIFDPALPGGKIILIELPSKGHAVSVTFEEGIELDANWKSWVSPNKDQDTDTLDFGPDT